MSVDNIMIKDEQYNSLQEDNKLLESRINIYKEELSVLKGKLDYTGNLFALYESVLNCAKEETKELSAEIKALKAENTELKAKLEQLEK